MASALLYQLLKPITNNSPHSINRSLLHQPLTPLRSPTTLLTLFFSSPPLRLLCSSSSLTTHILHKDFSHFYSELEEEEEEEEEDEEDEEPHIQAEISETKEPFNNNALTAISLRSMTTEPSAKPPSLTVKEKKELAAYAHSLGKKLKTQQVGKSGVTSSLATSFVETLEANELLKLKIHNSCPGDLADVVRQLEEATGSVAIGQIGRSVILYRPSLSKMKAAAEKAEKRKQVQSVGRKRLTLKSTEPGQVLRLSGRGRRGSSRV